MFALENQLPSRTRVIIWCGHCASKRSDRGDAAPEVVEPMGHSERLVALVVGGIKALMVIAPDRGQHPATSQREEPLLVDGAFQRAAQVEEVPIAPRWLDEYERGGVFQQCAGLAVPGEAVREATG